MKVTTREDLVDVGIMGALAPDINHRSFGGRSVCLKSSLIFDCKKLRQRHGSMHTICSCLLSFSCFKHKFSALLD
jgi:hypothetical protein